MNGESMLVRLARSGATRNVKPSSLRNVTTLNPFERGVSKDETAFEPLEKLAQLLGYYSEEYQICGEKLGEAVEVLYNRRWPRKDDAA
jgi:hypothetical protein